MRHRHVVAIARSLIVVLVDCVAPCSTLLAQPPMQATGERRDELARIQDALADPDPLQRLANLEAIIKRNDPLQTQVAIRTAFASDDAELRGLAMRGFLATAGEITFDIALPADVQRAYAAARADPLRAREFTRDNVYVSRLSQFNFKLRIAVTHYDFPQATGTAEAVRRRAASFVINGSRFASLMPTGYGECYVDFAPTSSPALEGTLACQNNWPKLAIRAAPL